MKILIAGDTHGKLWAIDYKLKIARDMGIQKVIVAGDFGLWTHTFAGQVFIDKVQALAEKYELSVFAIGGNHENWDHWEWAVENLPKSHGWAYLRSRILLAPKAHKWTWDHKQFISAGGAISVDRDWFRIPAENGTYIDETGRRHPASGPRTLYWPNEALTDEDVAEIKGWSRTADYLITHDCSNKTPWNGRLKPDMESEMNRKRIDQVLLATAPKLHFHGHMHTLYDWPNMVGERNGELVYVQTYGLECDDDSYSWGILDTETDTFTWRDEG